MEYIFEKISYCFLFIMLLAFYSIVFFITFRKEDDFKLEDKKKDDDLR